MYKQSFIPGFPEGAQRIGEALSILKQDGWVTYFVRGDNYLDHKEGDKAGERYAFVIASPDRVRGFNIRNPCSQNSWIPGRGPV